MTMSRILFAGMVALGLGACAQQEPFVFKEGEFNRARVDFGRQVTERDAVTICYASNATTPKTVQTMAAKACGEVGKKAVFKGHGERICPLLTPAAAVFDCVKP